ncbi:MAG TPA: pantoate--beta-alanine ligase [Acidimicrobiales bacterium]|nr:pantoate--beta-alanine ligase [Acidimicrobiales bacterium]
MAPVLTTAAELRPLLDAHRASGGTVGLVGTSGGLHEGHLSLIRRSVDDGNLTVLWLFTGRVAIETGVLPSYQRDYDRDQEMAMAAGASIVFRPPNETLFKLGPPLVSIAVAEEMASPWPGMDSSTFIGMLVTILAKAINVVGPCRLYSGEKDWQNVAVLRRMVVDLDMPAEIVPCPTAREPDGLVLGSRNKKLTPAERVAAQGIKQALDSAAADIAAGNSSQDEVEASLRQQLAKIGQVEYGVVVEPYTLQRPPALQGALRILVSVAFSETSIFDNLGIAADAPVPSWGVR